MGKRYIFLICPIGQINMALHALIKFMKAKTVLVVSYVLIVRELKKIIGVFIIMKNGKNKKHLLEIYFQMKQQDRKSTRLNSSHVAISYAVFCLKKKKTTT